MTGLGLRSHAWWSDALHANPPPQPSHPYFLDVNHNLQDHLIGTQFFGYWQWVSTPGCEASVKARKRSLTRAACCATTLWLNEPTGLFVTAPALLTHTDYFHLAALPPPICLSPSYISCLLVGNVACHCILSCSSHGTVCYSIYSLPLSPPSLLSFLPTSLFPLIICYATLALQGSSHWSPFLSTPILICYATAIPSYTTHWSLSTELSISLSLSPSSLFTPLATMFFDVILWLLEICFSLHHATEVFFICNAFISRGHKGYAASGDCVWGQQFWFCPYFHSGGII